MGSRNQASSHVPRASLTDPLFGSADGDADGLIAFTGAMNGSEFQHSDDEETHHIHDTPLYTAAEATYNDGTSRTWLGNVWRRGTGMESVRANHHFTSEEKQRLNNIESIDYLAPNSVVYRKWLARQPHRRYWDRWVMMGAIGVTTGFVGYCLYMVINVLAFFKYGTTRWLISHTNMGVAWLFNTLFSLALVGGASFLVVGVAPSAQGSGVPEVMAYLNGCLIPKVFNIFTISVKFLSCALAVASGLPVGPEGPLIHIGAALGAALSQTHSTTLGFNINMFRRFRNPKDKRDFVTAGVAVGVAAAFNAPIGGLLFAFEEVASFWQHSLGWQLFFASMCAVLTLNLCRSAGKAVLGKGHFGWFDRDVTFEVGMEISSHILAVAPALVIGLIAGLTAVCFTMVNLRVSRVREAIMARFHFRWKRLLEPCIIVVIYITGCMVLPLFSPCTPTECFKYKGQVYCGGDANSTLAGGEPPATPPVELPIYTCSVHVNIANSTWLPSSGTITPDAANNATSLVYYNELATLLLSTGEDVISHLLSRGTHHRFGYHALLTLLAWYFMGSVVASTSAISVGLFVPMLMMGATIGRICGLVTVDIAEHIGQYIAGSSSAAAAAANPWTWIDPGFFALVGAGAFMSGVTRLTVALAVIMIEISDDVHMLLPVLVGIMVAKWVADAASHSLYHAMLDTKCVPFLPPEPVSRFSLDLMPVTRVMRSPVVCMKPQMTVQEVQEALRDTPHNGFPVVRDTSAGQVFIGTITRSHLTALLQKLLAARQQRAHGSSGMPLPELSYPELNRKMMDPVMNSQSSLEQQMAVLQRPGRAAAAAYARLASEEEPLVLGRLGSGAVNMLEEAVDLTPYINTSAIHVPCSFSVERTYILFRTMGLRHLVVVDEHHHVKGIVTRKDLLGYRLDEAVAQALPHKRHNAFGGLL